MEIDKILEHSRSWFGERIKSPYFGSVFAVWIISNRKVVFSVFNFQEKLTIDERVEWIHKQFQSFQPISMLPAFSGFYATIVWSLFVGFIIMILYNRISGIAEATYKFVNKGTIKILQKVEPPNWVAREVHSNLESRLAELDKSYKLLRVELNQTVGDNEKLRADLSDTKSKALTLNDDLENLKQELEKKSSHVIILNGKLEELNDMAMKQKADLDRMTSVSLEYRTVEIIELQDKVKIANPAPSASQWIYQKTRLVHDFVFDEQYKIAVDTVRYEDGWEIQLFGRDSESTKFLLGFILRHKSFIPFGISNLKRKGERLIFYSYHGGEEIQTVANGLIELLAPLEQLKKGISGA